MPNKSCPRNNRSHCILLQMPRNKLRWFPDTQDWVADIILKCKQFILGKGIICCEFLSLYYISSLLSQKCHKSNGGFYWLESSSTCQPGILYPVLCGPSVLRDSHYLHAPMEPLKCSQSKLRHVVIANYTPDFKGLIEK